MLVTNDINIAADDTVTDDTVADDTVTDNTVTDDTVTDDTSQSRQPIPIHYLYDNIGSEIYRDIIATTDYYPYHSERELLQRHTTEICSYFKPGSIWLEIGCGTAEKILPVVQRGGQAP